MRDLFLLLAGGFVLVGGLFWLFSIAEEGKTKKRQAIAIACEDAKHYDDCRLRFLDSKGWSDPNKESNSSTMVIVQ